MVANDYKWFSWIIPNKSDSHEWLQIKVMVTNKKSCPKITLMLVA